MGWHVALGGSCLYAGESSNDIDVVVYRHKPPVTEDIEQGRATLQNALLEFGQALFKTDIKNVLEFDEENRAKIIPVEKEPTYSTYVPTVSTAPWPIDLSGIDANISEAKDPFYSRVVVVSKYVKPGSPFQCYIDWFVMIN